MLKSDTIIHNLKSQCSSCGGIHSPPKCRSISCSAEPWGACGDHPRVDFGRISGQFAERSERSAIKSLRVNSSDTPRNVGLMLGLNVQWEHLRQNILAHLLIHVDYFSSFSKRCGPDELNLPKRGWCASKRIDQAHWSVAVLKLCSKCLFKYVQVMFQNCLHSSMTYQESHNYSTCLNSIDSWIIHHGSYHTHTHIDIKSAMDCSHKPFQPCVQWPSCQEALLRGNATKELEAVQQAAAEARTLLETTPDLGKMRWRQAKKRFFKLFNKYNSC